MERLAAAAFVSNPLTFNLLISSALAVTHQGTKTRIII